MRAPPVSGIIFGILNIGYGVYNVFSLLFLKIAADAVAQDPNSHMKMFLGDPSELHKTWTLAIISAIAGLFLTVGGLGLLMSRSWGRVLSLGWAIFDTLFTLASTPFMWSYSMKIAQSVKNVPPSALATVLTLIMLIVSLIPPALLLIFLNRPKMVTAYKKAALN